MSCANCDPVAQRIHGGGMHGAVHFGVGGDMTDVSTSTNDPIFWLRTSCPLYSTHLLFATTTELTDWGPQIIA